MPPKTLYFVCGGIFADAKLDRLEDGTRPECHGPFHTQAEAQAVRLERNRRSVDICWHHLYVTTYTQPG